MQKTFFTLIIALVATTAIAAQTEQPLRICRPLQSETTPIFKAYQSLQETINYELSMQPNKSEVLRNAYIAFVMADIFKGLGYDYPATLDFHMQHLDNKAYMDRAKLSGLIMLLESAGRALSHQEGRRVAAETGFASPTAIKFFEALDLDAPDPQPKK